LLHNPPNAAKLGFGSGLGDAMEHFFYVNMHIALPEHEYVRNHVMNAR
jgi:hypothetical protein